MAAFDRERAPHQDRRRRRGREQRYGRRHSSRSNRDARDRSERREGRVAPFEMSANDSRSDWKRGDETNDERRSDERRNSSSTGGDGYSNSERNHHERSSANPSNSEQRDNGGRSGGGDRRTHERRSDQRRSEPRGDHRSRSWPRGRGGGGNGNGNGGGSAPRRSKISVPDNWDDVPKMGARVASSRFVALRVPLDDKFSRMIKSPDELWTPEIFLQAQADDGYNVRLLIDLTNTTKYYDGELSFRGSSVQYVKLAIEGFKAPPRQSDVESFERIVDDFIASDSNNGVIAVHCTHGLNRTGYLVVSYLVRRGGFTIQDALQAFSDARPPGLIKHMYIEDLYRRFAPGDPVVLPELPAWAAAKYGSRRH